MSSLLQSGSPQNWIYYYASTVTITSLFKTFYFSPDDIYFLSSYYYINYSKNKIHDICLNSNNNLGYLRSIAWGWLRGIWPYATGNSACSADWRGWYVFINTRDHWSCKKNQSTYLDFDVHYTVHKEQIV